jgi:hypothetical protein
MMQHERDSLDEIERIETKVKEIFLGDLDLAMQQARNGNYS